MGAKYVKDAGYILRDARRIKEAVKDFDAAAEKTNFGQRKKFGVLTKTSAHIASCQRILNDEVIAKVIGAKSHIVYLVLDKVIPELKVTLKDLKEDKKNLNQLSGLNPDVYADFESFYKIIETIQKVLEDYKALFLDTYIEEAKLTKFKDFAEFLGWWQVRIDNPRHKLHDLFQKIHESLNASLGPFRDEGAFQKLSTELKYG